MDLKAIEESYGFKILSIEQTKNIYRAETDKGSKCIKRAHLSPSYFLFMYSAINHLKDNGFEGVIPYDTCIDGSICVEDGKYIYYVTNWVESRECKYKYKEDLRDVIKTAADFHKATIGYSIPEGAKPRILYNKWTTKFNKKCIELLEFSKAIDEKEYMDEFDELFAKYLTYYWNQGRESIQLLNQSAYSKISEASRQLGEFCHHDMANHNFIRTPEDKIYMIDFDYCILDTRLHDVASLVIRNMRHGVWDISKASYILEEYCKYYTLSNEDLGVIKSFMVYPQDFWQVGLQYYVEKQPWIMDYFILRLNRVIEDKEMRQKFLDEFLRL